MEEATMKKVSSLTALGFMLAILFAIVLPARADDVDTRFRTLEEELTRLKVEQALVKSEQIELKKNALAAEGALPTFSYRAGNGLVIEAADKAWSIRMAMEAHMRINFQTGLSHAYRTNGEVMGRRFRPRFNFCVVNCFYEIEYSLDNDGFGTGNAKNATNTATGSILQRGIVWVHLEQVSPWLPTFYFGMDGPSSLNEYLQGSSSTGAQMDYDLLNRNSAVNTGRFGNGIGFNWDDKPLDAIGIPGRISRINLTMASVNEGDDGLSSHKDAGSNFTAFMQIQPFSQLQSKWLQGIGWSIGTWFCSVDGRANADNGCGTLNLRDNGDGGRQVLFSTGDLVGRGLTHVISPGFQWEVGPYRLRAAGVFVRYDVNGDRHDASPGVAQTRGTSWLIAHELFVWSPKGFLTGSAGTPGSVLFGTHFERNSVDCNAGGGQGGPGGTAAGCGGNGFGGFNRNVVLLREWDVWYFLMNQVSIGITWVWYDAKNMPAAARHNILGKDVADDTTKGGNWLDVNLNFRYRF
jgi:hypothetical protein